MPELKYCPLPAPMCLENKIRLSCLFSLKEPPIVTEVNQGEASRQQLYSKAAHMLRLASAGFNSEQTLKYDTPR